MERGRSDGSDRSPWGEAMRILIAEDDAAVADLLRERLAQEHFVVQLTSTGAEAQRLAANQPFDFVILDWNLQGRRGPTFCAPFARKNRNCR